MTISISSLASVGSVRNSRAPARIDLRIKVLSQLALAGSTTAFGIVLHQVGDQLNGLALARSRVPQGKGPGRSRRSGSPLHSWEDVRDPD